jgi:hypothetical protein
MYTSTTHRAKKVREFFTSTLAESGWSALRFDLFIPIWAAVFHTEQTSWLLPVHVWKFSRSETPCYYCLKTTPESSSRKPNLCIDYYVLHLWGGSLHFTTYRTGRGQDKNVHIWWSNSQYHKQIESK